MTGRLAQLVPSRLIVTAAGAIEVAPAVPVAGAVESFWTSDPLQQRVEFRTLVDDAAPSGRMRAEMMWQCGSTEHWYCDSSGGYGYCENYYEPYYCDSGGGGGYTPPPGDTGGGTPPTQTPQQQQQQLYSSSNSCTETPSTSQFLDANGYNATGMANYFSFAAFKSPDAAYVLVDPRLVNGLAAMQSDLDTMSMPHLSLFQDGAGYRIPGANGDTPCGAHCYGRAVDLSIRNSSGAHDCQIWNVLAGAASSYGWVEPAQSIRAGSGGTLDHFHVTFDGRTSSPSTYGDGCAP
jgi:hypothetical protein